MTLPRCLAACCRTSRARGARPMYGVSGHNEPSVVNQSDHSAGSELPLRGRGREHRSPSSAFANDLLGQTLLPQTRLFSWLDWTLLLATGTGHAFMDHRCSAALWHVEIASPMSGSGRTLRRPPRSPPPPAGSFPGPGARCRSRRSPCPRLDSRTVGVDVRTHTVLGHRPAPARVGPRW